MTDRDVRTKKTIRGIVAIILIALAVLTLAVSVFGFVKQGAPDVRDSMLAMRDEAVIQVASRGLINSVAQQAVSEKMDEHIDVQKKATTRTAQGFSNEEMQAELDKAEAATRAEAEKIFIITGTPDAEALSSAVDQMAAAVSESTDLREKEIAIYDDLYRQLVESVPRWQDIVTEDADNQAIADALVSKVPDLGKEENSHLLAPQGFLKMAREMAKKEKQEEEQEQKDHLLQGIAAGVNSWLDFAELEDDAIWEKLQADIPELAEETIRENLQIPDEAAYEKWKKELVDAVKECVKATQDENTEMPAWALASSDEESETTEIEEIRINHDYFVNSDELNREEAEQKKAYAVLEDQLKEIIPALDNLEETLPQLIPQLYKINSRTKERDPNKLDTEKLATLLEKVRNDLNKNIEGVLAMRGKGFDVEYQAYADNGGKNAIKGSTLVLEIAAMAKYLLLIGVAVLLLGLVLFFWKGLTTRFGVPRTIIMLFFIYLCLLAEGYRISVGMMLGNVLERMTMYGILVLAMMPGIQCGIGLNMGMTIGCISGLLGIMIALQYNMVGFGAMAVACLCGVAIALPLGWGYSKLLNRMKGNEMTISTYVGFSFVSLMCIGWMLLPFNNPKIVWLLSGKGLRVTHGLLGSFAHILDNALSFKVLGIKIPTGGLLFLGLCCVLMWIFTRSRTGIAMKAVGSNPRFAEASGISVNRMRTIGTVLSTVIAAVGIVIYSQAFGYAQLYTAPKQLGFIASSAILIGGASVTKAKVSHVLLGVFLFEGVLVFGQQIANSAIAGGGLSEVMRILISNGIILYALTQSGGGRRE